MESANIPTVFVIDDDADIRASIRGLLKSAGLRSEGFERAEQFLQTKLSDSPSCLVLDVSLPGINGLEFQQQLTEAGRQIPIIFVTGLVHLLSPPFTGLHLPADTLRLAHQAKSTP
jgi:FixJ family two-component response regulator